VRRFAARLVVFTLAVALALSGAARGEVAVPANEELHYGWRLQGFLGSIAALFFPSRGVGTLSLRTLESGHLESELLITSDQAQGGDFFRFGAEWDPVDGKTIRVWSASQWRGERRDRQSPVGRAGVVDIASSIYLLRKDPPATTRRMEIWSDGRIYPVEVVPLESAPKRVGGRLVAARHFTVRGVEVEGERFWKGGLELWLAEDGRSTPIEIVVARTGARVRLELADDA